MVRKCCPIGKSQALKSTKERLFYDTKLSHDYEAEQSNLQYGIRSYCSMESESEE